MRGAVGRLLPVASGHAAIEGFAERPHRSDGRRVLTAATAFVTGTSSANAADNEAAVAAETTALVFDMRALALVDGPFTMAHGRGSSTNRYGVPTRFSNASGSEATSLGLYLAEDTYDGGMVFLFAPDADWMSGDPWVVASAE